MFHISAMAQLHMIKGIVRRGPYVVNDPALNVWIWLAGAEERHKSNDFYTPIGRCQAGLLWLRMATMARFTYSKNYML